MGLQRDGAVLQELLLTISVGSYRSLVWTCRTEPPCKLAKHRCICAAYLHDLSKTSYFGTAKRPPAVKAQSSLA